MKMSPWFKKALYVALASSWISGITFFIMNKWLRVEGDFGLEKHPWQFNVLSIHGFVAFMMLMIFGAILVNHTPMSWKTKRLRTIGLFLSSLIVLQILSAYLLYYVSNESFRLVCMYLHLSIGASLPMILLIHIRKGKNKV